MSSAKDLLTQTQSDRVIQAIKDAEGQTSGEIRLHLEDSTSKDVLARAEEVFLKLGMTATKQRNGMLIYVAVEDHQLAILGDSGVNDIVGSNFWEQEKDILIDFFKKGEYAEGLVKVIGMLGGQLKKHFPYQRDDVNELPNEISVKE